MPEGRVRLFDIWADIPGTERQPTLSRVSIAFFFVVLTDSNSSPQRDREKKFGRGKKKKKVKFVLV